MTDDATRYYQIVFKNGVQAQVQTIEDAMKKFKTEDDENKPFTLKGAGETANDVEFKCRQGDILCVHDFTYNVRKGREEQESKETRGKLTLPPGTA